MKIIYTFFLSLWTFVTFSQVDKIHIGNLSDQESAIFQLDATDKGLLIPRMTSSQRLAIPGNNPSLLVYDTDTHTFWYSSNSGFWIEMDRPNSFVPNKIEDEDGNTSIIASSVAGLDQINIEIQSIEKVHVNESQFIMKGGNDLLIGDNALQGAGAKFLFDESKAALRAGNVTGWQWDPINIGDYSFAAGLDNVVAGDESAGWGKDNAALVLNTVAFGENNTVDKIYSTIWGTNNVVTGIYGTSWGNNNLASFSGPTTWGTNNEASQNLATAWGINCKATAAFSTAFGNFSEASSSAATAWGSACVASGENSTAFGRSSSAVAAASTTLGVYAPNYGAGDLPRLLLVGNGTGAFDRSSAMEVIFPNETRMWESYQTIVESGNETSVSFIDTLVQNNAIDTSGFAFVYDGGPDLFHLKKITSFFPGDFTIATWTKAGKYGIGRTPLNNTIEVEGNASKLNGGNWVSNSDKRLKKNIQSISDDFALQNVLAMRGVSYKWNDQETGYKRPESVQMGFIAQELQDLFPSKVVEDATGYLMTAYGTYDAIFVQGFKAQQSQLNLLETQATQLSEVIKSLQAEQSDNQQLSIELKANVQAMEKIINQ